MTTFSDLLKIKTILFDGAMGTELQKLGLPVGVFSHEFNITEPEKVLQVHKTYLAAGVHCITTNTFCCTNTDSVKKAVSLAQSAVAGGSAFVFGGVGPAQTGDPLVKTTLKTFLECGLDSVIFESFSNSSELKITTRLARKLGFKNIISSLLIEKNTDVAKLSEQFSQLDADVVGLNCGQNVNNLFANNLIGQLVRNSKMPIITQPSAGSPVVNGNNVKYKVSPQDFHMWIKMLQDAGVKVVGGCCGIGPGHIKNCIS